MARASVCLVVYASVVLSNAIQRYHYDKFYFVQPLESVVRRAGGECNTCYGNDCFIMNQARCEFYSATSELLYADENEHNDMKSPVEGITRQVDTLMMNLVEQASSPSVFKECIPLVSAYTDCSKENECLGCKKCSCDEEGLWNCTIVQNCASDSYTNVDHRALVTIIEGLRENIKLRKKRWIVALEQTTTTKPHKLTYDEISEWLYGVKPLTNGAFNATSTSNANVDPIYGQDPKLSDTETVTYPDYLAFDEVLNNINVETKTNNRRRLFDLTNNTIVDHNYMKLDTLNATYNKATERFIDILNAIEEQSSSEATTQMTTEVVIDLLEVVQKKMGTGIPFLLNVNDSKELNSYNNKLKNNTFENTNDIVYFNIMKREISKVNELNSTNISTPIINSTSTDITTPETNGTELNDLLKTAMDLTLDKIIQSKQNELKSLMYIKEKILQHLRGNNRHAKNMTLNETSSMGNINNAYFSFYNIEISPKSSDDRRSSNINKNEKYLDRLKQDILVVMRDIVLIQKFVGKTDFPPALRNLLRAMRHYIHTEGIYANKKARNSSTIDNPKTRRHWYNPYPANKNLVRRYLLDIFQVIDKDMPQNNALAPLTPKSKEIIQRIIKQCRTVPKTLNNSQISDPYRFSTDLSYVGLKWKQMTTNILNSQPADRLYHMKLFYLLLVRDITKIEQAVERLDFFGNRRLITVKNTDSEHELKRINDDLKLIYNKINKILQFQHMIKNVPKKDNSIYPSKPSKKETLLKHVRNLIRNSKQDIVSLLRNKVPKREIVKELARKKLNELAKTDLFKYENVMQKWQKNLNIVRKKRAALTFDDIKNRIRNILPKYLRGKVHSGIKNSTKSKKRSSTANSKKQLRRNKNRKTSTTTMKITTVPKSHTNSTSIP